MGLRRKKYSLRRMYSAKNKIIGFFFGVRSPNLTIKSKNNKKIIIIKFFWDAVFGSNFEE